MDNNHIDRRRFLLEGALFGMSMNPLLAATASAVSTGNETTVSFTTVAPSPSRRTAA